MNPSLPQDPRRDMDEILRRLDELETAVQLRTSATGAGGTAFAPQTYLQPGFVAGQYSTEVLAVNPASGWVDLAISEALDVWQDTVTVQANLANGSPGEVVELRLWDNAAGQAVDGPRELVVDGTPQLEQLTGTVPYTAAAPGGTARTFAVQVRTTSVNPADVVFEWGPGRFTFEVV